MLKLRPLFAGVQMDGAEPQISHSALGHCTLLHHVQGATALDASMMTLALLSAALHAMVPLALVHKEGQYLGDTFCHSSWIGPSCVHAVSLL